MTTYTAIPLGDVDQDSSLTQPLFIALRDNPLAIQEGDPSAPKIDPINAMAHGGVQGEVGTYVFAYSTTVNIDRGFGDTVGGSTLRGTSAAYRFDQNGGAYVAQAGSTGALSGTWRCMGFYDYVFSNGGNDNYGATLWLRIL